jgi:hypothetical protein
MGGFNREFNEEESEYCKDKRLNKANKELKCKYGDRQYKGNKKHCNEEQCLTSKDVAEKTE